MKKILTKHLTIILGIVLGITLSYGAITYSQSGNWFPYGGNLKPIVSSWGLQIPSLVGGANICATIDADGVFSTTTCASGGSSKWTDSGTFTYLTATTDDIVIGASSTSTAPFWFDASTGDLTITGTSILATTTITKLTVSGATTLNTAWTGIIRADSGVLSTTTDANTTYTATNPVVLNGTVFGLEATTSAAWATFISNETGTGKIVFDTSPAFTTPNIGSATGNISGNAGTATALASNPTDCGAGNVARSIDASGNLTCSAVDISADTNLAAGRSLTMSGDSVVADSELYTDTKCIYFEDPTAADDFKSLWRTTKAITITEVWCESDQTIDFDLQEDDGTPADIIGTDLQCAAGENSTSTAFADAAIAANSEIDLVVTSVANTPTWCSICWTYTKDD